MGEEDVEQLLAFALRFGDENRELTLFGEGHLSQQRADQQITCGLLL